MWQGNCIKSGEIINIKFELLIYMLVYAKC